MKPKEVLCIVDDDDSIRDSVGALLRSLGFSVSSFASAEAFLESPSVEGARCLILDVSMPGMTGPQLQRYLIAEARRIPIVFISAQWDPRLEKEALESGAVAFIRKPFGEQVLLGAIQRALLGS